MILVLNNGSSSVKYAVIDPTHPTEAQRGLVEHLGEPGGPADHHAALGQVFDQLHIDRADLRAVGHRVVHGGGRFTAPTLIDEQVIEGIRDLVPLAPLHNPASIAGINAARTALPDLPQVAVFDTAFHHTLPELAATYAIDRPLAQRLTIRRYGFHGTSFESVAAQTATLLRRPLEDLNLIVLHLGNGASAAAIAAGRSVETSMGLTPSEGLVMGTRGGDLDPAILTYLQRTAGMDVDDIDDLLQHRSGLLGLCGVDDMRTVLSRRAGGDADAAFAFDVYCHRIRKYIGAYHAVLGRIDAIVYTAGVGEHAAEVRAASIARLDSWGIIIDPDRNASSGGARIISPDTAPVAVCVVPTDEELAIARHTTDLIDRLGPANSVL
jgi:acetate kinase